jgi:DUF4097 and DUF4098 domain-containing protein YvlB
MRTNFIKIALILFTIPIETKNSISNLSSFFKKNKEEIIHQEFNDLKKLDLTNLHGDISVETWKQPCVMIELHKKGSAEFSKNSKLKHTHKNNGLTAQTEIQGTQKGQLNVRILVPENFPLKLTTNTGNVTTKGNTGPLDITTSSGNIIITLGMSTVIAQTDKGNITIQRKSIKTHNCLNLNSVHGNITLMIPQDLEADLEAHNKYGKIISDLFITLHSKTVQLNEKTFKEMKVHIHGWVGQPSDEENPATILLNSDFGTITITGYSSKMLKK